MHPFEKQNKKTMNKKHDIIVFGPYWFLNMLKWIGGDLASNHFQMPTITWFPYLESGVPYDFHPALWDLSKEIQVDFVEENESVMGTCDGWFTLGSMSTYLKLAKVRFR